MHFLCKIYVKKLVTSNLNVRDRVIGKFSFHLTDILLIFRQMQQECEIWLTITKLKLLQVKKISHKQFECTYGTTYFTLIGVSNAEVETNILTMLYVQEDH